MVRSHEAYSLPGALATGPEVEVEETVELVCDKKGVESFDARVKAGGTERHHEAVRKGIDYQVTSTLGTTSTKKTITAGVQTTNIGLYCGAFLKKQIPEQAMFENYPMLLPAAADHRAGQMVREGSYPVTFGGTESVPAFIVWVKRLDKKTDKFWFSDDADQILIRKEQGIDRGTLVYEIVSFNGAPYPPKTSP
jgi:hypothetical protein